MRAGVRQRGGTPKASTHIILSLSLQVLEDLGVDRAREEIVVLRLSARTWPPSKIDMPCTGLGDTF